MSSSTHPTGRYSEARPEIERDWASHNPLRRRFERMVFCNGCFDVMHVGHLSTLAHARSIAGPLGIVVVGINSDSSVRRLKGDDRPIFDEESRAIMLSSLKYVDYVLIFEEDTPMELIESIRPDVIVKGGDYSESDVVGREIALVSIAPSVDGCSTTEIVRRIKSS